MSSSPIGEYKGLSFCRTDGKEEAYIARATGSTILVELEAATGKWRAWGLILMANTRDFRSHISEGHKTPRDAADWVINIINSQGKIAVK